ncbi:uncharacterized protein B0T23DRAFT_35188 [Neurospora hispaniola]|uniref:Uncharacterized protein n=1 Tax=Neurospora hispaniola TaxID=588809 RepID=A0AAJ0IH01_9PEZI|nr:hypothetical protein B0T23DRAFT_35188 [Neurospora hispaniola]
MTQKPKNGYSCVHLDETKAISDHGLNRRTDTPPSQVRWINRAKIRAGLEAEKSPGQPRTSPSNFPQRKGLVHKLLGFMGGYSQDMLWATRIFFLDFLFFCMTGMAFAYSCLRPFVQQERSLFPWQASTRWKAEGGRLGKLCLLCVTSSDTGHSPSCFGFKGKMGGINDMMDYGI